MKRTKTMGTVWRLAAVGTLLASQGCGEAGNAGGEADGNAGGTADCNDSAPDLEACFGPVASEAAAEAVARQIKGRDLSLNPPRFLSMRVHPHAASTSVARLEVEVGEELPRTLNFIWNDRVNTLRDDGTSGDTVAGDRRYSAFIELGFAEEAGLLDAKSLAALDAERAKAMPDRGSVAIPLRDSPASEAEGAVKTRAVALASDQCVGASCVDVEKAFVIRRTGVVNSNRTSDPCLTSRTDTTRRAWNFGYLLSKLSSNPSNLAKSWLSSWIGPRTVNGLTVSAPTIAGNDGLLHSVPGDLLQDWQSSSQSSTLAMSKAPFRLLAIVNRFDLRTNIFFGPNYAGELRFVFTPLSLNAPRESGGECGVVSVPGLPEFTDQDPNTIILEYRVSLANQSAVRTWATSFRDLGRMSWSTTSQLNAYLTKLEGITESIVTKGASALHRIRTNDATTSFGPWHLREFEIKNGALAAVTVKQTPDLASLNESKALAQFLHQNYDALLRRDYFDGRANMPDRFPDDLFSFLGAQSLNITASGADDGTGAEPVWQPFAGTLDYTNPSDIEVRHVFALGTCNGCHGHETIDGVSGHPVEFFAHIMPRKRAQRSELSSFLTGVPMGEPLSSSTKVNVPDPMAPHVVRHFNELVARNQKMADYLDGRAAALAFQPSAFVH